MKEKIEVQNPYNCTIGCNGCEPVCPRKAISFPSLDVITRLKRNGVLSKDVMAIYLDHNATTPIREEVCNLLDECNRKTYGNSSSPYQIARKSREKILELL
ncbi:MAG: hypothetical protein ACQEP5_09845 [Actinomycetota bacterium]